MGTSLAATALCSLLLSSAPATPPEGPTPSGTIAGAGTVVSVFRIGTLPRQAFRLAPGTLATVRLGGPARVTVELRAVRAPAASQAATLTLDGREMGAIKVPVVLDPMASSDASPNIGMVASSRIDLSSGAHEIKITWPAKATVDLLFSVVGAHLRTEVPSAAPAGPVILPRPPLVARAPPPPTPPPDPTPARRVASRRLAVAVLAGAAIPRSALASNGALTGELSYRLAGLPGLPSLGGRLSAVLDVGYTLLSYRGAGLVPGRGYDGNFVENAWTFPIELGLRYHLALPHRIEAIFGASYALLAARTEAQAFGARSSQATAASGLTLGLGVSWRLGTRGALMGLVQHTEASLGGLPELAAASGVGLRPSSTRLSIGYAFDLI